MIMKVIFSSQVTIRSQLEMLRRYRDSNGHWQGVRFTPKTQQNSLATQDTIVAHGHSIFALVEDRFTDLKSEYLSVGILVSLTMYDSEDLLKVMSKQVKPLCTPYSRFNYHDGLIVLGPAA